MLYPTSLLADALADRLVEGYGRMFGTREPEWADVIAVARAVRADVAARFGVDLEPEPVFAGTPPTP